MLSNARLGVWELVEDDDRVLIGEILEERLPVLPNPLDTGKRIRGRLDELFELQRSRFLSRLIEDSILVVFECLFDEPCLSDSSAAIQDSEFRVDRIEEGSQPGDLLR
jgi:hypothetical protein